MRLPSSPPLIEDVVADLVENPNRIITRSELDGLGDIGATLSRWGALRPGETLTSIACTSCGDDHFVELDFDPATQMWRYYCGSVGLVPVATDDLVTFRFDLGWLADRLAEGLLIGRPRRRELVADVLWDLGDASLGGRNWSAFLARTVDVHLDPILGALRERGGKLSGLVLASSPFLPSNVPLPHGHRFMPLRDAVDCSTGLLEVDHHAVLTELRPGRQGRAPQGASESRTASSGTVRASAAGG